MSTTVTYVGTQYRIPAYQDTGYAQGSGNLSSYLIALATGSLTLSGGTFTLTADVNFGTSFGLISKYFKALNGTAAAPSLTFNTNANTGFYLFGANAIGVTNNGTNSWNFTGVGDFSSANGACVYTGDGLVSKPGFGFNLETSLGIYRIGSGIMGFVSGSAESLRISASVIQSSLALTVTPTTNQLILGATRTVTITAPTPASSSRTVTLPDLSGDYSVVGTIGNQTIGGSKTFSSAVAITATSAHIVLSTSSNTLTIQANAQATSARTWSIPDISGNGTFAALEAIQTFSAANTFSAAITITPTTNQLVLGTTRTATITAPTPASSSRTYTFADLGGDYSIVGTIGNQTIAGTKTFSSAIIVGGNTTGDSNYGTIASVSFGFYYEGSFSATFTGPFDSGAKTIQYVRIGNMVILRVPSFTGSSSSAAVLTASGAIPTNLRPTALQIGTAEVEDNGAFSMGEIQVGSGGNIVFAKAGGANFTNTGMCGPDGGATIAYTLT